MTPSVKNAEEAAQSLREKYPERKITVIDSLCSSSGYGMLVDSAADLRDAGVPNGRGRPVGAGKAPLACIINFIRQI